LSAPRAVAWELGVAFAPKYSQKSRALAAHLDSVFRTDHHHIVASGGARSKAMGIVAVAGKIFKRRVEGKAIEALQLFDR
jgi:hypothetical protein